MELKRRRNRIIILVLAIFMLTTLIASAAELKGTIIASEGIVRKTGSFSGEILDTLGIGTSVSVLEHKNSWYRVKAEDGSLEGWIYEDLMVVEKSEKTQKGITTASVLNVRHEPSTSGRIISRFNRGTEVIIVGAQGDWYQIRTAQVNDGWVHRDFVKVIPNYPVGVVLQSNAALKEGKDSSEKTILTLKKDDRIYIKGYEEGWYLIVTENFVEGWVLEENIELEINVTRPVSRSGERGGIFTNITDTTNKYLGKRYGWGQAGPDRFDCSGFTFYILNTYYGEYLKAKGITLPRSSRDQANVGTNISRSDLRVGDLVFFNTEARIGKNITHVGIYIGDGQFVHASSARSVVMISSLAEGYYNTRYIKAVRL